MYTSHGHHIPGSPKDEQLEKAAKARCGGPGVCNDCSREASRRLNPTLVITSQAADGSVQVVHKSLESHGPHEYVDENTLFKVMAALRRTGLEQPQIERAIGEMQNAGILFREYIDG